MTAPYAAGVALRRQLCDGTVTDGSESQAALHCPGSPLPLAETVAGPSRRRHVLHAKVMRMKTCRFLSAALILASTQAVLAQPAGGEAAPPAPPAPPDQPVPPTPPVETTPPVEATAVAPVPDSLFPPAAPEDKKKDDKPAVSAKYDNGLKLSAGEDLFGLEVSFRNQMRFEGNRSLEDGEQWEDHFYIARTRMQVEGYLDGEGNKFKVEFGFGDAGSFAFLKEMWIDRQIGKQLFVRTGLWRRPFSRQELVSDFAGHFMERSIANEFAGGGRDLGIALHNDYDQGVEGIEWIVGVFNGFSGGGDRPRQATSCDQDPMTLDIDCSVSRPNNFSSDFGPTVAARVGYSSPKMKGLSENDLEGGPLRYAVGVGYKIDLANFDGGQEDGWGSNTSHGLQADALIKSMGFSVHVMAVMMKLKSASPDYGALAQLGYMVMPKKLEVAGRFSLRTDDEDDENDTNELEVRAALNYFLRKNYWRIGLDCGWNKLTGDGAMDAKADLQVRAQLQMQI